MPAKHLQRHDDHYDCFHDGRGCFIPEAMETDSWFVTTDVGLDERKEFHDETLSKLAEDVNRLFMQAMDKKKDNRIGIAITPKGMFPIWIPNQCPNPNTGSKVRS